MSTVLPSLARVLLVLLLLLLAFVVLILLFVRMEVAQELLLSLFFRMMAVAAEKGVTRG